MDCPRCGNEIGKSETTVESQSGLWRTAYKCPFCELVFKKKTLLRKGLGWAGKASLTVAIVLLGDDGGGGDCGGAA
jgi:hypothetical protein